MSWSQLWVYLQISLVSSISFILMFKLSQRLDQD